MFKKPMKALITSEVSSGFVLALEERGIEWKRAGWGLDGKVLLSNELLTEAENCQIVIVEIEELTKEVISRLPHIAFIGVSRGNPVNVDVLYCAEKGITVVSTPGRNADSVADYCIGAMLSAMRGIFSSNHHLTQVGWMYEGKLPYLKYRGKELGRSTVGIYGMGAIGKKVAYRLHRGFGTNVLYFDPFVAGSEDAKKVESLEELFEVSNVISLHAAVNSQTKNSVNADLIHKLGEDGFLINSARADLIVESDLYQSVVEGHIGGVVLDVFWKEPVETDNKWLALENVLCTPHIAGASNDVIEKHCEMILAGLDRWIATTQLESGVVND